MPLPEGGGGGAPPVKKIRENAVYVTKLPQDVTMEQLSELFGSIGVIKVNVHGDFKMWGWIWW